MNRPFLDIEALAKEFQSGCSMQELAAKYQLTILEVEGIIRVYSRLSRR